MDIFYRFKCQDVAVEEKDCASATTSLLYNSLPTFVQGRLPRIPSVRTVLVRPFRDRGAVTCARLARRKSSSSSSDGRSTPPPLYCEQDLNPPLPKRRSYSSSSSTRLPAEHETESRVRWKFANSGLRLLMQSVEETNSSDPNGYLSLQLYISGLQLLLSGLPDDLAPKEAARLRVRLAAAHLVVGQRDNDNALHLVSSHDTEPDTSPAAAVRPSGLHRLIANLTLYIMLIAATILPYIQFLLQQAYRYERRHRVTQRLLAQSFATADTVRVRTVALACTAVGIPSSQIGEAARLVAAWGVQGVVGGLHEGMNEGMRVLGREKATRANDVVTEKNRS